MTIDANEEEPADTELVALYTRFHKAARAMGCRDSAAEDRVQDAYVRLLESTNSDAIRDKPSYLRRILRNLKIDDLRLNIRRASVPLDDLLTDPRPGPDKIAEARAELARVAQALERLPPRCRKAFELHRFSHLSYAQIASQMEISISMVEKHIAEAILRLSKVLDK